MAKTGVLITGFPAPVAYGVVARLLDGGRAPRLVFVVEPRHAFLARDRCIELERRFPQLVNRWRVAPGDLRQPDLGLTVAALVVVREEVGSIWHLADSRGIEASLDLAGAYALDVGATTRVLDLCETTPGLERLVYLSSVGVAGDRRGRVYEDQLDEGQGFDDPRDQTKCWAELQVQQRWARIPTVVLRPSMVASVAQIAAQLGGAGSWQGSRRVNMVPLPWLVDAMVTLSEDPRASRKVFHLSDPRPPRLQELRELWGIGAPAPGPHLRSRLLASARRAVSRVTTSTTLGGDPDVIYDLSNSAALLSELGRPCPPWEDYLPPPIARACTSRGAPSSSCLL